MPSLKAWFKVLIATATIVKAAPTPRPAKGTSVDPGNAVGIASSQLAGDAPVNVPRSGGSSIFRRALRRRANSASSGASSLVSNLGNFSGFIGALQPVGNAGGHAPGDLKGLVDPNPRRRADSNASDASSKLFVETLHGADSSVNHNAGSVTSYTGAVVNKGTSCTDRVNVAVASAQKLRRASSSATMLSQTIDPQLVAPECANGSSDGGDIAFLKRRRRRRSVSSMSSMESGGLTHLTRLTGVGNVGSNGPSGMNSGNNPESPVGEEPVFVGPEI